MFLGEKNPRVELEEIARGGFGTILKPSQYLSNRGENLKVVVKRIENPALMKTVREPRELYFLKRTRNVENVINLIDYFKIDNVWYLVLETFEYTIDLWDLISSYIIPTSSIRVLYGSVLKGLENLYSLGIYHQDLKDENIIVSSRFPLRHAGVRDAVFCRGFIENVKIIDFGNARERHDRSDFSSTTMYSPPEIILDNICDQDKFAAWNTAALLATMIYGNCPFGKVSDITKAPIGKRRIETMIRCYSLALKDHGLGTPSKQFSFILRTIIEGGMRYDYKTRLSINDIFVIWKQM